MAKTKVQAFLDDAEKPPGEPTAVSTVPATKPTKEEVAAAVADAASEEKVTPPKTMSALVAMPVAELDALQVQEDYTIGGFDEMTPEAKKAAIAAILFPKKKAASKGSKANDPMTAVQQELEKLDTQEKLEIGISELVATEGLNDYKLGGFLQKLMEVGKFDETVSFKDYVEERWGLDSRKAYYLMSNYNGLIANGIPWETVSDLGWSKIMILIKVLTPENVDEWVEKAKSVNNVTLKELVKAALAGTVKVGDAPDTTVNFKTLTYRVSETSAAVIENAINTILEKADTKHTGVALEYMATEFLGSTMPGGKEVAKFAALKTQIEALEQQLKDAQTAQAEAQSEADINAMKGASPLEVFKFHRENSASVPDALQAIFGDSWDQVFPEITVKFSMTEPAAA